MPLTGGQEGRGHAVCSRYLGLQKPLAGGPPSSPGGPEVSYGHIRQPERETNHPLLSWYLVRACSDLLPGRSTVIGHFLCAWYCGIHSVPSPKVEAVIPIVQMRKLRLREVM